MKQTETNWSLSGLILKNFLVLLSTSEGVNLVKVTKWGEIHFSLSMKLTPAMSRHRDTSQQLGTSSLFQSFKYVGILWD